MNRVLFYFTWKYKGDWESIYNALESKENIEKKDLNKVLLQKKDNYLCLIDFIYPENLKFIYKPPFSLFWEGDFNLFSWTNQKSYSITNLTDYEIIKFQKLFFPQRKKSNICFCITTKDQNLIELFKKENYKFILVSNMSIKNTKEKFGLDSEKNSNCLIVTEIPESNKQRKITDHAFARIWSGLTRKVCIGKEKNPEYLKAIDSIISVDQITNFTFESLFESLEKRDPNIEQLELKPAFDKSKNEKTKQKELELQKS